VVDSFVYMKALMSPKTAVQMLMGATNQHLEERLKNNDGDHANWEEVLAASAGTSVELATDLIASKMTFGIGKGVGAVNKRILGALFGAAEKSSKSMVKTVAVKTMKTIVGAGAVAAEEGLTEAAQEAMGVVIERLHTAGYSDGDIDKMFDEKTMKRIREAGYMGAYIGHGQAVMGKGLNAVGYGAGKGAKGLAEKISNKYKKESGTDKASNKARVAAVKKRLQADLRTRGEYTDTVDLSALPDEGLMGQFKELKVLYQASQQVGDDRLEKEYGKRLKLFTTEVGKRLGDRKGSVEGLIDRPLGNREVAGDFYDEAFDAAAEAIDDGSADYETAKLIHALGGLDAVNIDGINDNVKDMLKQIDGDLADVMTAEFVDKSSQKDTAIGKFVKDSAMDRVESIEKAYRDTSGTIQKLQNKYINVLKKIGKSRVKDGTSTKGAGDTDYSIGLKAVAAGENVEALRDLVGETSDAGVAVKDVIQHLITLHNKEDKNSTVVGKKIKVAEDRLKGLISRAKRVGAKINTSTQRAGYETLVTTVAEIGELRAQVEGTEDAEKRAEASATLGVLEKSLNEQLIGNTLFNKDAVMDKLVSNLKAVKKKQDAIKVLSSKKDLQAFMKAYGRSIKSPKIRKAVNAAIKKMKATDKIGGLSKGVRAAILRAARVKRTEFSKKVKSTESAIRFVGLERYNGNSVKNGALDIIAGALADKEVTVVKSIEKRKETKSRVDELRETVKSQIADDTGLESLTVSGKKRRKVAGNLGTLEKTLESGESTQKELREAYASLEAYKRKLDEEHKEALDSLKEVHEIKADIEENAVGDAFQEMLMSVISEHDGVLSKAAVGSFITRAKATISATERKIELKAQFDAVGMPTVETIDRALELGSIDDEAAELMKEVIASDLDAGEMKVFGELVKFMYSMVPGMDSADVLSDEDVAGVLTSYLESRVDMMSKASKVLGAKSPIKVAVKEEKIAGIHEKTAETIDRFRSTREAVQQDMQAELRKIRTAKTMLSVDRRNKELSRKQKSGLQALLKDAEDNIKKLKKSLMVETGQMVKVINESSLEAAVNDELKKPTGKRNNVGKVVNTIESHNEGGKNHKDVTSALNSIVALTDMVTFSDTMANSIDFEAQEALKALADDVNEVLSEAFYKGTDVDFNVHLYAKNVVQRSLMTLAEGANKSKLEGKDLKFTDTVAFAIHTTAMSVLDTELLGWIGYKDDEQLNKFFGNPEATGELPGSNKAGKLRHAYPLKYAQDHAGKIFAKALGMDFKTAAISDKQRAIIYTQLGHIIITYMKQAGYLKKKDLVYTVEQQNVHRVKGNKITSASAATQNFVVVNDQYKGKNVEKLRALINEGGISDFLDVFMPDREANKKFDTVVVHGKNDTPKNTMIGKNLSVLSQDAISSAENTAYTLNQEKTKEVLAEYDQLTVKEDGTLKDPHMDEAEIVEYVNEGVASKFFTQFGVMTPKEIAGSAMLYSDRNAAYENYSTFVRTLGYLRELDDNIDKTRKDIASVIGGDNVGALPVYTKYFYSKNGRFFMDAANGLNPQTEKELARWLLTPSGTTSQVVTSKEVMTDERNSGVLNAAVGVAQAFGHSIDKSTTTESIAFGTRMLQMNLAELKSMRNRLAAGEDVQVEYGYRAINFVDGSESGVLKKTASIGKEHEVQRQVVLDSLIERAKGSDSLTAPYEIDGVTNGTYFKTAEAPVIEGFESMLSKTGFYTENMKIFGTTFGKLTVKPSSQDVIALTRHVAAGKSDEQIAKELGFAELQMSAAEKKFFNDAYVSIIDGFTVLETADDAMVWVRDRLKNLDKGMVNAGIVAIPQLYGSVRHFMPSAKDRLGMVTKAFRDFVKYPKMTFDYGAAVNNVRKTFVNDITNAVLTNVLTEAQELLESTGDIDRKKYESLLGLLIADAASATDKDIRKAVADAVAGMQKMDIEKAVKMPKMASMDVVKINGKIVSVGKNVTLHGMVSQMVDVLEGNMIKDKLLKDSSALIDYNNTLNTAAKLMGHIFKVKLEKGLEKITEYNKADLSARGIDVSKVEASVTEPSIKQVEELIVELDRQGFTPVVKVPGSSVGDGSGIELIDTKVAKDSDSVQAPLAEGAKEGKNSMSKTVSTILKEPAVVHALASVTDTHFSDGAAMAELLKRYGVTPIHDAVILNGAIADRISELYGEKSFTIMMAHSPVHNYADKLKQMSDQLTAGEMEVLLTGLEGLPDVEKVILPARYAVIDENGIPEYGNTVQEEIDKESKVDVTPAEDLLEQMRRWGLLVAENKDKLLAQDIWISQLAGTVNGVYEYKRGSISHGLTEIETGLTHTETAVEVTPGVVSKKVLPERLFKVIWGHTIRQAIGEITTISAVDRTLVNTELRKAVNENPELAEDKKYWSSKKGLVSALTKISVIVGQREGKLRELTDGDVNELIQLLHSAAGTETPVAIIDLYNEYILPKLKERGLDDLGEWVEDEVGSTDRANNQEEEDISGNEAEEEYTSEDKVAEGISGLDDPVAQQIIRDNLNECGA